MINKLKKITKWQWFVVIFFFIFFLIGTVTFKDYGMSEDEILQYDHSLVSHYYLRSVFKGKVTASGRPIESVQNSNLEKLIIKHNIERNTFLYKYKYYGVAIQLPLNTIEHIFNYKLDISTIFYIRHFYTFFIFFLSLIFLYKLLSKFIVKNKKLALLAVFFMILSPRIYGNSFYNIKDLAFMSLTIINLYYCMMFLENSSKKNIILLALTSAISINSRIVGIIYIFITIFLKLFNKNKKVHNLKPIISLIIITFLIYILVTPTSWNNPFIFPFEVLNFFFNYNDPLSNKIIKCLYFGKTISSRNLPWHYLPVWITITTPILYLILSIFGFIKWLINNIKNKFKKADRNMVLCNIILIFILLFIMIIRPTMYGTWRHFYFIYPLIIINTIIGIKELMNYRVIKKILVVLLIINSIYISTWMIKNHPYEYEYFELFLKNYTSKNFDVGLWNVSNMDSVSYILNHDKNQKVCIYSTDTINYYLLNEEKRNKLIITSNIDEADYIIDNGKQNPFYKKKYKEFFYKKIDNYRIYTIYKK